MEEQNYKEWQRKKEMSLESRESTGDTKQEVI